MTGEEFIGKVAELGSFAGAMAVMGGEWRRGKGVEVWWEVETNMCGRWENCWRDEGCGWMRFSSFGEARAELDDHVGELEAQGMGWDRADYRIVRKEVAG